MKSNRYEIIVERDQSKASVATLELLDRVDNLDELLADSEAITARVEAAEAQTTLNVEQAGEQALAAGTQAQVAQAAAAIAQATSGAGFPTRAALVAAVMAGHLAALSSGQVVSANGLRYRRKSGATVITDMSGWVPGYGVNVDHFGAVADATSGVTGSGTDNTGAFQSAADYAMASGITEIHIGSCEAGKAYRLAGRVTLAAPVQFVGISPIVDVVVNPRRAGGGSWVYFDHTDHGFYFRNDAAVGTYSSGGSLRAIGVDRNQSAPAADWVPVDHLADIRIEGRVELDDVIHLKSTRGVLVRSSGVLTTRKHRGQVFVSGVEIERSADVQRHEGTHWWPFWSTSADVLAYSVVNGVGWDVTRSDGLKLVSPFTYGLAWLFKHEDSDAAGSGLGELSIVAGYADKCGGGAKFVTNNYQARGTIDIAVNADPSVGGSGDGIEISGSVVSVYDVDLTTTRSHGAALSATGAAHKVRVLASETRDWDRLSTGRAAFVAENGAEVTLLASPKFSATPSARYDQGSSGIILLPVTARRDHAAVVERGLYSLRFSVADDAVQIIPMPAGQQTAHIHLVPAAVPSSGSPSVELWGRATSSPALTALRNSHATNFATTTGVLAGTTGTDGNLTVSCANNGNLYIENRTGSSKIFTVLLVGA